MRSLILNTDLVLAYEELVHELQQAHGRVPVLHLGHVVQLEEKLYATT